MLVLAQGRARRARPWAMAPASIVADRDSVASHASAGLGMPSDNLSRRELMARRRRARFWNLRRVGSRQPHDDALRRTELMALRRLAKRRRRLRRLVLSTGLMLLVSVALGSSAIAWFTTAASVHASITTGTWGTSQIKLCPGAAKAPHVDPAKPACPKLLPIAFSDAQGTLALDFGDQKQNTSVGYCDVIRIASLSATPITVTFTLTGSAASLVQFVSLQNATANLLAPGSSQSVTVKLLIPTSTVPGRYSGQLIIGIAGSAEKHAFSMVVNVLSAAQVRLGPGTAKAPHVDPSRPNHPTVLPIASVDSQGSLALDFGDQKPRTSVSYVDVFRASSLAGTPLKLTFATSGATAALIHSVILQGSKAGTLGPHCTQGVTIKLSIPSTIAPGRYSGSLIVGIAGTSETYTVSVLVNVTGKVVSASTTAPIPAPQSPPPAPSSPDTPTPSPPDTPTPSPADTPMPTPAPSDTPSPTPSDTPTPSPSPSSTPADEPSPTPAASPTAASPPPVAPTNAEPRH
jgi:hypothetical protein